MYTSVHACTCTACRQNYSYRAPLFATGEQFSLRRTVENFAPIATRIAERKTDKLRAAAKQCLRGTRGSKIRNRPRNQIVRRDNDDPGQRARRHRSDRLIVDRIFRLLSTISISFPLPGLPVVAISQPFDVALFHAFLSSSTELISRMYFEFLYIACIIVMYPDLICFYKILQHVLFQIVNSFTNIELILLQIL